MASAHVVRLDVIHRLVSHREVGGLEPSTGEIMIHKMVIWSCPSFTDNYQHSDMCSLVR